MSNSTREIIEILVGLLLIVVSWVIVALYINVWEPNMGADNWIPITCAFIWTLFVAKVLSERRANIR